MTWVLYLEERAQTSYRIEEWVGSKRFCTYCAESSAKANMTICFIGLYAIIFVEPNVITAVITGSAIN